ncbi:MAG: ABC transporter permease [Bacilli bacterium]|nr:ABC transporter permease [Bacilli bacterium]
MFIHNFKYTFKTLFKKKQLIFWTFFFPLILGTFFNMAFSDIENNEKLDIINIAIVNNEGFNNNETFKSAFKELSDKKNKDRLFNTKYVTLNKAKTLLKKDRIVGYLIIDKNIPKVVISSNGEDETVFKYVVEEISGTENIIKNLTKEEIEKEISLGNNIDYNNIYNKVSQLIANNNEAKINNVANKNLSYTMIEFYTLIAMACLYGSILSMVAINQALPNMGSIGKRVSITPVKKAIIIFSSLLASFITQLIGIAILFLYTIFVLNVDYGNHLALVLLITTIGSFAGLSLGVFVSTVFKTNDNNKTGIIIAYTMLGSFLSGMMGITMKYIIDKNLPIINKLNPVNMITDGLYSLYYYQTYNRYIFNIISLLVFSFILILISFMSLRRQKYDSI